MRPDARKLERMRRLGKVRALAKQQAARDAAEAESNLSRLSQLAQRTQGMADAYRSGAGLHDGLALRQQAQFAAGLATITVTTGRDAARAQSLADARQLDLAVAERRRAATDDRAAAAARALALRQSHSASPARRPIGTGLE